MKHDQVLERLRAALPLGESVKREAWVALSVRHVSDVVRGEGRVLLAGEAGGFMSPSSGEGISYALNTGRLAGAAVAENDRRRRSLGVRGRHARTSAATSRASSRWLPFMESRTGKYLAGFVPTPIVSRITKGL